MSLAQKLYELMTFAVEKGSVQERQFSDKKPAVFEALLNCFEL